MRIYLKYETREDGMNSFIKWMGGKKALRKEILEHFPKERAYDRYIEVFGGAGWILFAKDRHAKTEVYNDINGELVNLFRCVKHHAQELQRELGFLLSSREQFHWTKGQNPECMTDIQRAARFYVLIKESYGSDLHSFGLRNINLPSAAEFLKEASSRLGRVVIERLDFQRLIKVYDRPSALFYLDPPYYGAEKYYADKFAKEDHARLKETLDGIKGMFVLSYNECEEICGLYGNYRITRVSRPHNLVTKDGSRRYEELIITNF